LDKKRSYTLIPVGKPLDDVFFVEVSYPMSEQNGTNVSSKLRQSRQTKQTGTHANTLQHPVNDDEEAWKTYWKEQGQLWRTEPEIDLERKKYLAERREIKTSFKQGI
jgi:hypothetical protein